MLKANRVNEVREGAGRRNLNVGRSWSYKNSKIPVPWYEPRWVPPVKEARLWAGLEVAKAGVRASLYQASTTLHGFSTPSFLD